MKTFKKQTLIITGLTLLLGMGVSVAYAAHSWNGYHWARTSNPFTLKLGDNVSSAWDPILATTSSDWNASSILDTTIVTGQGKGNCRATRGRVEVCNKTYGNTGWLGIAQIWISGSHIVQGTVKNNDTYFNTPTYNTTAWRNLVMCQEVGHTFGLDHQDEIFGNVNLGTCMDYTSDPSGTLADPDQLNNEHPNTHDYDQLISIYTHIDTFTTLLNKTFSTGASNTIKAANAADIDTLDPKEWGKTVKRDARGKNSLYERNLGNGEKLLTFVIWAE